jgi:alkanesulfonate monooxygenase SsuD/methylene tetrahydromethanopterin reductase-like flavin-dependent oxidoreductase (luciferase family)
VKQATTLDVLSNGRAYFGVGAAWNEREHAAFGIPFPPLRERLELLEETLQVALRAWAGETGPFHGSHVNLAEQIDVPPPIQRPHPAILIGGVGERKTLRLVAQYAQATDIWLSDPAEIRHKLDVLRRHCFALGRDYDEIERFARIDLAPAGGLEDAIAPPDVLIERVAATAGAGADAIIVPLPHMAEPEVIERFGVEVITPGREIVRPDDA